MTNKHSDWGALRDRRMAEPGAAEAYEAARRAFESDRQVREPRSAQQPGANRVGDGDIHM
jgi:hypothetical protein